MSIISRRRRGHIYSLIALAGLYYSDDSFTMAYYFDDAFTMRYDATDDD